MTSPAARPDGRRPDQPRPLTITTGFTSHPAGSVLVTSGETRVICTASVEESVPSFLRGQGKGWITAEYGMLPAATHQRAPREVTSGKAGGRTLEIQRLIGRSLRSVVAMERLGERTIWIDCDVIQADGGTRTASITGAYVALVLALRGIHARSPFAAPPLSRVLAATSVGLVGGRAVLDLNYQEDRAASVDLNVVMTEDAELIEIQGTAEGEPFGRSELDAMLNLAESGIREHVAVQRAALGGRLL